MELHPLTALSPLDGRYQQKVDGLRGYFSEYALIKYRIKIEIEWLKAQTKKKYSDTHYLIEVHKKILSRDMQ